MKLKTGTGALRRGKSYCGQESWEASEEKHGSRWAYKGM